jgi:hypothetical protein
VLAFTAIPSCQKNGDTAGMRPRDGRALDDGDGIPTELENSTFFSDIVDGTTSVRCLLRRMLAGDDALLPQRAFGEYPSSLTDVKNMLNKFIQCSPLNCCRCAVSAVACASNMNAIVLGRQRNATMHPFASMRLVVPN